MTQPPSTRRRRFQFALVLAALQLLLLAAAQVPQPYDTVLYLGESARGRTLLARLELWERDAQLFILEAPARGNDPDESADLFLTAPFLAHQHTVEVTATDWTFIADRTDTGLDVFGEASFYLEELEEPIVLRGLASVLQGNIGTGDGLVAVQRSLPLFYEAPWTAIQFGLGVDQALLEGIDLQQEVAGEFPAGFFDSREVVITALDDDLLSYFVRVATYAGGAHPNSWSEPSNLFHSEEVGWQEVDDLCEAASQLGWRCDEESVRARVIAELLEQDAAWVVDGEVGEETEWLLDSFVLTPAGVRVLFDPYDVGPYVQGGFEVDLAYPELGGGD